MSIYFALGVNLLSAIISAISCEGNDMRDNLFSSCLKEESSMFTPSSQPWRFWNEFN